MRAAVALAAVLFAACAPKGPLPVRPAMETLPAESPLRSRSLRESDAWLRHYLMTGEVDAAAQAVGAGSRLAPRDRLVRALQEGIVLHQAGEFEKSNQALEWAEVEADRRYTQSVGRAAASLLVNDGVMGYTPPASELVMLPYYRMLNYLALGETDEALVEARKANALLARLEREPGERCREDGLVLYLAGSIQRSGGESNDALVSLRQAERALAGCEGGDETLRRLLAADLHGAARAAGVRELADSIAEIHSLVTPPADGEAIPAGDLFLLLEQGFVAHREEQALHIPIFAEEVDSLRSGDESGIAEVAARVAARLTADVVERDRWGRSWNDQPAVQFANMMEGAHVLRLAWPTLRLEAARPAAIRVWVDDSLAIATPIGDLSETMRGELDDRRAATLARLIARAVTKFLVAREMEAKTEKEGGEIAAFVVGRLANLAGNRLEQADLRSWSLLPDRVSLVRARLPEGTHRVRVETLGRGGEVVATRELGEVTVRAGRVAVLSHRVWGGEAGPEY